MTLIRKLLAQEPRVEPARFSSVMVGLVFSFGAMMRLLTQ